MGKYVFLDIIPTSSPPPLLRCVDFVSSAELEPYGGWGRRNERLRDAFRSLRAYPKNF